MTSMRRHEIFSQIERTGLVGIIRWHEAEVLVDIAQALYEGGMAAVEITLNSQGALAGITRLRQTLCTSDCLIGAGSVMSADDVHRAVDAGAQFIVSPTFKPEVVKTGIESGVLVFPGALTPGEILAAWDSGADMVKVFPANFFGPQYIRELLAPMSFLKLMPTGGVNNQNMTEYFSSGACCVAMGGTLVSRQYVETRDWMGLAAHARRYVELAVKCKAGG